MLINWITTKTQFFLPEQDAEFDELGENFDFALSAEIMALLSAQNDGSQQGETVETIRTQTALDEHELALA